MCSQYVPLHVHGKKHTQRMCQQLGCMVQMTAPHGPDAENTMTLAWPQSHKTRLAQAKLLLGCLQATPIMSPKSWFVEQPGCVVSLLSKSTQPVSIYKAAVAISPGTSSHVFLSPAILPSILDPATCLLTYTLQHASKHAKLAAPNAQSTSLACRICVVRVLSGQAQC